MTSTRKKPQKKQDADGGLRWHLGLSESRLAATRRALPTNSIIEVEEGYQGRIRAKVISGQLNGMREQEKQN